MNVSTLACGRICRNIIFGGMIIVYGLYDVKASSDITDVSYLDYHILFIKPPWGLFSDPFFLGGGLFARGGAK